jgi:hypothetical protein
MFQSKINTKTNLRSPKKTFCSYTGKDIEYKSNEYSNIMNVKCLMCLKGFRSHSTLLDILIKDDILYYIGCNNIIEIIKESYGYKCQNN